MDSNFWAHFHVTVNEIPILGFFFASVFMIVSLAAKKPDGWTKAGMLTLAISIAGGVLAFLSGDPAVDVISGQRQTSNRALSQHHIRAIVAVSLAVITSIIMIVTWMKARKSGGLYSKNIVSVILAATLITFASLVWTGLAGGRVNHPELQTPDDRKEGPAHEH